jgi:hypothetical protein
MEKSTSKFAKYFYKVIEEDMTAAGAAGALGPEAAGSFAPNASTSTDSYAPGDARVPKALGKVQRRADVDPKKKKKKKKKAKKTKSIFSGQIKEA